MTASTTAQRAPVSVRYLTVSEHGPDIDLLRVHGQISAERSMRKLDLETLKRAYLEGRAVILEVDGEVGGFIKIAERLGLQMRERMGISHSIPRIFEEGSAVIAERYQGLGLFAGLKRRMLEQHLEAIVDGDMLLLGCTITIPLLYALRHNLQGTYERSYLSGDFHSRYPLLIPLFCSCEPHDQGESIFLFGCPIVDNDHNGLNMAPAVHIDHEAKKISAVAADGTMTEIPNREGYDNYTSMAVFYLSNSELAIDIEKGIRQSFANRSVSVEEAARAMRAFMRQ